MKPHRVVLILVFGILGFVLCPFFGPAAWVMGNNDLQEMAIGRMDSTGRDLTKAGRICGMIATALLILQMLLIIILRAFDGDTAQLKKAMIIYVEAWRIGNFAQSCRSALTGSMRAARAAG